MTAEHEPEHGPKHESEHGHDDELEIYGGDSSIASRNAPTPSWLIYSYIFWIVVGVVSFCLYWNGSNGWQDRGYWQQLQRAANTTMPFNNADAPYEKGIKHDGSPKAVPLAKILK